MTLICSNCPTDRLVTPSQTEPTAAAETAETGGVSDRYYSAMYPAAMTRLLMSIQ